MPFIFSSASFIASGFGVGFFPWAPGTFASFLAAFVFMGLEHAGLVPRGYWWIILVFFYLVGVWACDRASLFFKRTDHPAIVWDEICAVWLLFTIFPESFSRFFGLVFFRFFDIFKPYPIVLIDRYFRNGVGVMGDDLMAIFFSMCLLASFSVSIWYRF